MIEKIYLVNKFPKQLQLIGSFDIDETHLLVPNKSSDKQSVIISTTTDDNSFNTGFTDTSSLYNAATIGRLSTVVNMNYLSQSNNFNDDHLIISKITLQNYDVMYTSSVNSCIEETTGNISTVKYNELLNLLNQYPPIKIERRLLKTLDGKYKFEYNAIDTNVSRGWKYIKVKFISDDEANDFNMKNYITNFVDITGIEKYTMDDYWKATRTDVLFIDKDNLNSASDIVTSLHPYVNAIRQFINDLKQYMYDNKNMVGEYPNIGYIKEKNMWVIPGGFRNIRLAVMGDEFKVHPPHFHFFRHTSPISEVTGKHGGALLIKDAMHFKHDSHQDRINYVEIQALNKFLESNYPGLDISIWQFILEKWNEMNPIHIQEVDINSSIPKYVHNMPVVFGR